jgi:hypothetical protein
MKKDADAPIALEHSHQVSDFTKMTTFRTLFMRCPTLTELAPTRFFTRSCGPRHHAQCGAKSTLGDLTCQVRVSTL